MKHQVMCDRILSCEDCPLRYNTTPILPVGNIHRPTIMFVSGAPNISGLSKALLSKAIKNIGLIENVHTYHTSVVKCNPPNNRKPRSKEIEACIRYLIMETQLIKPVCIVLLGTTPTKRVLLYGKSMTELAGRYEEAVNIRGLDYRGNVMPTFHPSFVIKGGVTYQTYLTYLKIMIAKMLQ